jgi:hypothetical protein
MATVREEGKAMDTRAMSADRCQFRQDIRHKDSDHTALHQGRDPTVRVVREAQSIRLPRSG